MHVLHEEWSLFAEEWSLFAGLYLQNKSVININSCMHESYMHKTVTITTH